MVIKSEPAINQTNVVIVAFLLQKGFLNESHQDVGFSISPKYNVKIFNVVNVRI